MSKKHVNAAQQAQSQRAKQAAERKKAQQKRGSAKFDKGSNPHHGASRSQSGQPKH